MGPETRASALWQSGAGSLLVRVVDAVADATGTDPLDLPPLYDAVGTEQLAGCVAGREAAPSGAADRSRTLRYERGGRDRVLVTEPDREAAWLQSGHAVEE